MSDTATTEATATETTEGQSEAVSWLDGVQDTDDRQWLESRGYQDLGAAVKGHRELEGMRNVPAERLLTLPEDMSDPAAMGDVYNRLGRPESVDGYEIKAPEGVPDGFWDEGYAASMAERAHALGLTKAQMQGLVAAQVDYAKMQGEVQERENESAVANLTTDMMNEWGGQYETNLALARKGAALAGDDATKDEINALLGSQRAMKFWARLGGMMAEGSMPGETSSDGGESAKTEIDRIEASPEFKSYLDKAAAGRKGEYTDEEKALVAKRSALFGKL